MVRMLEVVMEFLLLGIGSMCIGIFVLTGLMNLKGAVDIPKTSTIWLIGIAGLVLFGLGNTFGNYGIF